MTWESAALSNPQCEAYRGAGLNPSGDQRCHRRATKLAIGDDGETFRLCGNCARSFEGGMREVRDLTAPKRGVVAKGGQ